MRAALKPLLAAAAITVVAGAVVSFYPYLPGDVAVTRAVQSALPDAEWWATPVSRLASAPAKYLVMGLAVGLSVALSGWRGAAVSIAAIALDQYGAEASKALFARPRPSSELVAVVGAPSGFSFPSGTLTFLSATVGWLLVQAWRAKPGSLRTAMLVACPLVLVAGCLARVVLGAHWPSDVVLTTVVCLAWLWVLERGR